MDCKPRQNSDTGWHTLTSAEWTLCSACHELLCSRAFLFIVLRKRNTHKYLAFLQNFRGIWPMPFSLVNHSAIALFAQRTRVPTSARSIGFCAIWVCISSSSREGPLGHKRPACMLLFAFLRGGFSIHCHSANEEGVPVPSKPFMAKGQNNNRRLAR